MSPTHNVQGIYSTVKEEEKSVPARSITVVICSVPSPRNAYFGKTDEFEDGLTYLRYAVYYTLDQARWILTFRRVVVARSDCPPSLVRSSCVIRSAREYPREK